MPLSAFRAALARILREYALLRGAPPRTLVAALSGGRDSVTLLHLLARSRGPLSAGCSLLAAHVNHGLRPEAEADAAFCRAYARRLEIPFAESAIDVAALAREEGVGIEEAGRRARQGFFRALAGENGLVLAGHHADDQAETILLHLRRGAHRRGLAGMREFAVLPAESGSAGGSLAVGRPLLAVPKGVLGTYALAQGLEWREDATNAENAFARNKIRNKILPALERLAPGFRDRLLARAAAAAKEEDVLARAGAALAARRSRREGGGRFFRVDAEALADAELFAYALRHVVEEETRARLSAAAVPARLAALAEKGRPGETVTLPGLLRVRREADGLFFFFPPEKSAGEDAGAEIVLPGVPFRIDAFGLRIDARAEVLASPPPDADRADPNTEHLFAGALRGALRLRPPFAGERFRPLGSPGSRKIQDILVDEKIPRRLRALPRVLADDAGALWVWPLRLAERARLPDFSAGSAPVGAVRFRICECGGEQPDRLRRRLLTGG